MHIFNRKELRVTRDAAEEARVGQILDQAGIAHSTRCTGWPGRSHGTPGIKVEAAYEYHIYVAKRDYERAKGLV